MLVILPFAAGLIYALFYSIGFAGAFAKGFTLQHIKAVLYSNDLLSSFLYSLYIALSVIVYSLLLVIPAVAGFHRKINDGKKSFLVYLPLAVPAIVASFISFQVMGKTGVLSSVFFKLGIIKDLQQFPDVVNDVFATSIIATHILMAVPFFLIYFSNLFLTERLQDMSAIAASLGAGKRQILQKLVFPVLLKRGLAAILLYFIFVFGSYEIPLLLGRQQPQMISVLIVRKLQRFNLADVPQGYFLSLLYSLLMLVLLSVFLKLKNKELA